MGTSVYTELQCLALRELRGGPRRTGLFDKRTTRSLIAYGLVAYLDEGLERLELTERGHAAASTIGVVPAQPVMRFDEIPPPAPDGMAEVCCEAFEAAVAAEVIVVGTDGATYINTPKKWWRIAHCPWCPEERP